MIDSNRLAIIVPDNAVYDDNYCKFGLDLSTCGIPEDVHALQWQDDAGHIEYTDTRHNDDITELPEWAINCYNVAKSIVIEEGMDTGPIDAGQ